MSLNLPPSWSRMPPFSKLCYLVNSKQARDFTHAGKLLAGMRNSKPKAASRPRVEQRRWDLKY